MLCDYSLSFYVLVLVLSWVRAESIEKLLLGKILLFKLLTWLISTKHKDESQIIVLLFLELFRLFEVPFFSFAFKNYRSFFKIR